MFTPHMPDRDALQERYEALRKLAITDGTRSETFGYPCATSPGDGVNLTRVGPKGGRSTQIAVEVVEGPDVSRAYFTAATARRAAARLIELADEVDPINTTDLVDRVIGGAL